MAGEVRRTNKQLVEAVDIFPYTISPSDQIYSLIWSDNEGTFSIGYITERVLGELRSVPLDLRGELKVNESARTVEAFHCATEEERSNVVASVANFWRQRGTFAILRKWKNEAWPVYGRGSELLFSIERAAAGLFGVNRFGVHLTAFTRCSTGPGIKIWVPKRSETKETFPGLLDSTVGGGLMTGEIPLECLIREAEEEASLPELLVRSSVVFAGKITYVYVTDERSGGESGLICPECEWVYDIELPEDIVPKPMDGEVEFFKLCTVDEVKEQLAKGLFKPNSAAIMLDFFIRHGILTEANEPELETIQQRLHRPLPFPSPHTTSETPQTN